MNQKVPNIIEFKTRNSTIEIEMNQGVDSDIRRVHDENILNKIVNQIIRNS